MIRLTHLLFVTSAFLLSLALFSCNTKEQDSKYRIALTIAPTQSLIEGMLDSIALDSVELKVLLPDGAIPEGYEPTVEMVSFLERCDAWYYVGDLGFESQWIKTVQAFNPNIKLVRLDEGLQHIEVSHRHGNEVHRIADPHYWVSVEGLSVMYRNVEQALREVFGNRVHSEAYDKLCGELKQRAKSIRTYNEARKARGEVPAFIVYHPALTYYARECAFEQWVIEQDGKEPTPQYLAELSHSWQAKEQKPEPKPKEELNLLVGKPKFIILKEYRDVSRAIARTYGLACAENEQGVFELNVFAPNIWETMALYLYNLQ